MISRLRANPNSRESHQGVMLGGRYTIIWSNSGTVRKASPTITRCNSEAKFRFVHLCASSRYGIPSADGQSRRHGVLPTNYLPFQVYSSSILHEMLPTRSTPDTRTATRSTDVTRSINIAVQVGVSESSHRKSLASRSSCTYLGSLQFSEFYHACLGTLATRPMVYRIFPRGKPLKTSREMALKRKPREAAH